MQTLLPEAVGTMMLVLLGDGAVAKCRADRTKGQNAGWIVITVGGGVAMAMAVYAVGRISGAHLNPAVTHRPGEYGRLLMLRVHRRSDGRLLFRGGSGEAECVPHWL